MEKTLELRSGIMYDLLNINVLETQGALQSRLGFSPIGLFNYLPPLSAHSYTSKHCQMSTLHFSVRNYHETLSLLMVYILAMFTACIRRGGGLLSEPLCFEPLLNKFIQTCSWMLLLFFYSWFNQGLLLSIIMRVQWSWLYILINNKCRVL